VVEGDYQRVAERDREWDLENMARMPIMGALAASLLLCPAASARIDGPSSTVAGQTASFDVTDLPPHRPFEFELAPALVQGYNPVLVTATGRTDADGSARVSVAIPDRYELCDYGPAPRRCESHPVFPGMALDVSACTTSSGDSGVTCVGMDSGVTVAGPRASRARLDEKVAPKRFAKLHLRGIRWTGWGHSLARGRAGRARLWATDLVDCGGRLHYSRLVVRSGKRRAIKGLAPCSSAAGAQVYPGARLAEGLL
jgi:hypothetical protein